MICEAHNMRYDKHCPKCQLEAFLNTCDRCGEPATRTIHTWDSCPTDRGEERREYDAAVCDECYKEQSQ